MTKVIIIVVVHNLILVSLTSSVTGLNDTGLEIRNSTTQIVCNNEEFKCSSGQCIPKNFTCDGIPHCDDASEETEDLCSNNECPEHNYRCAYGACISGNSQCNGFKECHDGSDEICTGCPSIYNNSNMKLKCFYANREIENCINPKNETIAQLKCNEFYEFNTNSNFETLQCIGGMWNQTVPYCKPVCGKKSVDAETLIINGEYVKKGDYPWQAALYTAKEKILFCGGSLISENIILTAAHCVTKGSSIQLIPKEQIFVAVGKYYRNFSDSRDLNFQHSAVKEIIITREYQGYLQNYLGDLALIITETVFKLSKNVQPVCIDWISDFKEEFSNPSSPGTVTGWGLTTENDTPSEILKELTVPYVQSKHCNLSFDFYQFLTHDKICAGYINNGSSVCKGDSGGGLVFPNPTDHRYYVVGIVSLSPRAPSAEGGCNSQHYGLYTRVSEYVDFMTFKTGLYGINRDRCILLDHPDNGYWVVKKSSEDRIYKPGMSVLNETRVQVYCKRGFYLDGDDEITCSNGVWNSGIGTCKESVASCVLPKYPEKGSWAVLGFSKFKYAPGMLVSDGTVIQAECETYRRVKGQKTIFCHNGTWNEKLGTCVPAVCPDFEERNMRKVQCTYNGVEIKNCTKPPHGTIAKVTCANFYRMSYGPEHGFTVRCVDGWWDNLILPQCVIDCGKKSVDAETLIINGHNATKNSHPWVTALYNAKTKAHICGGTLISTRIIITAAICVTNHKGRGDQVEPKESYIVAVGKYYRDFNDSRDHLAQFSKLRDIAVPEEFRGERQNYFGDLAVLITEDEIILSKNVLPACVDFTLLQRISTDLNGMIGEVTGWGFVKENDAPSEALQELSVPYVPYADCIKKFPEDFEQYLTNDKFCAGFHNGSSICKGDSGNGLIFRNEKDHRYYLVGIASIQPLVDGRCDSLQVGLYTEVKKYYIFLQRKEVQAKYI